MQYEIHICLISRQPVPNLIPLLDPDFKPRKVVMLVSQDMHSAADNLQRAVARYREIKMECFSISDPWNIAHTQTEIAQLLERLGNETDKTRLVLNATGGTKPMSIAAYEVCREQNVDIFYVHPEKDRIVWLHPPEREPHDLADRIKLEEFLQAHGAAVSKTPKRSVPDVRLLQVGEQLVTYMERYQKALGTLNYFVGGAEKTLKSQPVKDIDKPLEELIDLFEQNSLMQWQGNTLQFNNEDSRFFVNGGWLEYHLFDAVRQLRHRNSHIHDVAFNIPIARQSQRGEVRNELDVVFLHNNRLHIIECKTKRFRGDGKVASGNEALYKLDSLRDLMGGLQARAMLASFRDLDGDIRRRADDLGIHICAGAQLKNLQQALENFIR